MSRFGGIPDVEDARNRLGIGPVHAHRVVVSEGLHLVAEFAEPVDLVGRVEILVGCLAQID